MNAEEYRSAIARLGLSQVKAGAFLSIDQRTSRRYASDDATIPGSVALALALAIHLHEKHGMSVDDLKALVRRVIKSLEPAPA